MQKGQAAYRPLPEVRQVSEAMVQQNYLQIKQEVQDLVHAVMERLLQDPTLRHLIIRK